jgi:hypothetical protein
MQKYKNILQKDNVTLLRLNKPTGINTSKDEVVENTEFKLNVYTNDQ